MEAPACHTLAADLPKKDPKPGSDLKEADLINPGKGRAASSLHWLAAFSAHCQGQPFKMLLEEKAPGSYVGRSQRLGERLKQECLTTRP